MAVETNADQHVVHGVIAPHSPDMVDGKPRVHRREVTLPANLRRPHGVCIDEHIGKLKSKSRPPIKTWLLSTSPSPHHGRDGHHFAQSFLAALNRETARLADVDAVAVAPLLDATLIRLVILPLVYLIFNEGYPAISGHRRDSPGQPRRQPTVTA
jgi:hypothetical protein